MNIAKLIAAAFVVVAVAAPAAHAGSKSMTSAPALRSSPGPQTIFCDILNLNTTTKNVTFEILDYSGAVVSSLPDFPIAPNNGFYWSDSSGAGAYCRFTVDGSTKKYRAVAIYDDGTNYTVAIPAN